MRIGKNILLFVFILIISLNVTVYAQENGEKTENPVKVTQEAENDKDVLFTNSKGETVLIIFQVPPLLPDLYYVSVLLSPRHLLYMQQKNEPGHLLLFLS